MHLTLHQFLKLTQGSFGSLGMNFGSVGKNFKDIFNGLKKRSFIFMFAYNMPQKDTYQDVRAPKKNLKVFQRL